jgi:hypothetical protein
MAGEGWLRRFWYGTQPPPLQAAGLSLRAGRDLIQPRYEHWQEEVWALYDELGEFYYGVRWLAEMISRVRLTAAKPPTTPGEEPELVEQGPAAELVTQFGGGTGGAAQILKRLTVQLSVPGEGWLLIEPATGEAAAPAGSGGAGWSVRSADEVRRSTRRGRRRAGATRPAGGGSTQAGVYGVEVVDETVPPGRGEVVWRKVTDDALIVRVWNPHDRWYTRADSPAQHARQAMRELQLANRHIQATFLSRLASAGVFLLPSEASFPVRAEFRQFEDAFEREWIATAAEAIRTPGAASAVVPILMRMSSELLEQVRHIDFTTAFDEQILDKRDRAISRVATTLDLPKEVLLGLGDVNHWTAWQLEEGGVKVHIAPVMEQLCHALTDGWYHPILKEAGEDPAEFLLWYDPSEIVTRPDKSQRTLDLYDRGEVSGDALRRESGLDEGDTPADDDLKGWALRKLVGSGDPATAATAYELLVGEKLQGASTPAPGSSPPQAGEGPPGGPAGAEAPPPERGEPATKETPPPPPGPEGQQEPVAASVGVTMPGSVWPMERRADGWWVWNVNHWMKLDTAASVAADRSWAASHRALPTPAPAGAGGNGGAGEPARR